MDNIYHGNDGSVNYEQYIQSICSFFENNGNIEDFTKQLRSFFRQIDEQDDRYKNDKEGYNKRLQNERNVLRVAITTLFDQLLAQGMFFLLYMASNNTFCKI